MIFPQSPNISLYFWILKSLIQECNRKMEAYLNFKNEIVAPKSKGDDPKSIQNVKDLRNFRFRPFGVVGDVGQPALRHRHGPYRGAVADGGERADQRDSGNRVQVGQLRQEHRRAREH